MGYDTACHEAPADRSFLERGAREGRIVLSRKKDLARRQFRGTLHIVSADRVGEQLEEIAAAFGLKPRRSTLLTRCLACNELLQPAEKDSLSGRVPPYVLDTTVGFACCPRCGSIVWPGTHHDRMMATLERRNLLDRP